MQIISTMKFTIDKYPGI